MYTIININLSLPIICRQYWGYIWFWIRSCLKFYFFYCFETVYLLPKDLLSFLENKLKSLRYWLKKALILPDCTIIYRKGVCPFDKILLQLTGNFFFFKYCSTAIKVSFSFFEGFDLEVVAAAVVLVLAAMLKLAARD